MSSAETPIALIGTIAPTFQSNWWERTLPLPFRGKGVPIIGTALLISAAVMTAEAEWRLSSLMFESEVQHLAQLAMARMARQQDRMLVIGVDSVAPAKESGAKVLARYPSSPEPRWLVLADRSQAAQIPWLRGCQCCEPNGIVAWAGENEGLGETLVQIAKASGDTSSILGQLASDELAGGAGMLQSLSLWAYAGGHEWESLVVGWPGADPRATRAILANTATELGIAVFHCGNAIDLYSEEYPTGAWKPIPSSWVQLN